VLIGVVVGPLTVKVKPLLVQAPPLAVAPLQPRTLSSRTALVEAATVLPTVEPGPRVARLLAKPAAG